MSTNKLRLVTTFARVGQEIQEQIKLEYPEGFSQHLIKFTNKDGEQVSALRFETDDKIFLIKMSKFMAEQIILDDDDYDEDGSLTEGAREELEDRHGDDD
ncbi:MAG: hypothetical protein ACJATA_001769 [Sphingobacteriales bacterium]|jgi:hypothetical protein